LDPTSTSSGAFGAYLLATTFNMDLNDAGFLSGFADTRFGDLTIRNLGVFVVEGVFEDFSYLNGLSVREVLAVGNTCLGGGSCSSTYEGMTFIALNLSLAFNDGTTTQFAQDHLQVPAGPTPVPEPATLSLLGIGLAALTARRRKGTVGAAAARHRATRASSGSPRAR
jgi:hypothetical protein